MSQSAWTIAAERLYRLALLAYPRRVRQAYGEQLRVTRAADGTVTKLNWATYLFTREPIAFGEHIDT